MKNKRVLVRVIITAFAVGTLLLGGGVIIPSSQILEVAAQTVNPCLNRVNIPINELHWLYVPESANQLYTEEKFYYLAGELIKANVVDGSICPSGGLMTNGYANACGMAAAMPAVVAIQNMFNEPILQAWKEVGVPPVLLKQMIRIESQFWPTMLEIYSVSHYGFGMITDIGIRNALQWNPNLFTKACQAPAGQTCISDENLSQQVLTSLVNTCSTCEYGINPQAAYWSVDILAEALLGYCNQTAYLVLKATGWHASLATDYATIWKLTMMNYNAGPTCVFDSVVSTFKKTEGPMKWSDITPNVSGDYCFRGLDYANRITGRYFDFPPD